MVAKMMDDMKQWFNANRTALLGFAIGMIFVLAAAGIYRISWEFPESKSTVGTPSPSKAKVRPAPSVQSPKRVPQRATPTKPVLKKLDGLPEPFRRIREQQQKPKTP